MQLPTSFNAVIEKAASHSLYKQLIIQLNKDLTLGLVDLELDLDILPTSLKYVLHEKLQELIDNSYETFLNLLYIIDVPEERIKSLHANNTFEFANEVTFLIVQREWQKVWMRHNYS